MDDCSYYLPAEYEVVGVTYGIIWGLFTVVWLGFTACSSRPESIGMELFIAFVSMICSGAGFAQAFLPNICGWDNDLELIPVVLLITLSQGMFIFLQLLIARGYGVTRYELTLTEIVMFVVFSLVAMVVLVLPLLGLIYLVIYVLFIIYGCRTYSMLGTQNPAFGPSRNKAILKKQQIFLSMMLLVISAVLLSVANGIAQVTSGDDYVYRYLYVVFAGIVELVYAAELMLLQIGRNDADFSFPLVSADEIYLIRQSFIVPQAAQQGYYPPPPSLPPQPYFAAQPSYPVYNQPPYAQPNPYPPVSDQYGDRS
jgi:hypothetical protein